MYSSGKIVVAGSRMYSCIFATFCSQSLLFPGHRAIDCERLGTIFMFSVSYIILLQNSGKYSV